MERKTFVASALKSVSGLQEWSQGNSRIENVFQQFFPNSYTDDVSAMTNAYHNYKRKYIKHISFNPDGENLSKVIPFN